MSRKLALVFVVALGAALLGAPRGALAGAPSGDLTIVMSWQTAGTDMDLHVIEPSGERCWSSNRNTRSGGQLLNDCLRGPGQETYVHQNPPPGDYKIEVINYEGGPPTEVVVQVTRGGQPVGSYKATLTQKGQRAAVATVSLAAAAAAGTTPTPPQKGDLSVVIRWETVGTDIDLHVTEPTGEKCWSNHRETRSGGRLLNDCLRGPGQETYVHPTPVQGDYQIEVIDYEGGPPTPVSVEVRRGGQLIAAHRVTLMHRRERARVCTVSVDQGPPAPNTATAQGVGDLVVALAWATQGTDVDLKVVDAEGQAHAPAQDVTQGPGKEVCTIQNPAGRYEIVALYYDSAGNQATPVTVEVQCGGKPIGTYKATLTRQGETQLVQTVVIQAAPPSASDYVVVTKWGTNGTDVDTRVVGPGAQIIRPLKDCQRGPGEETCVLRNPPAGEYQVQALYFDDAGGQQTPLSVQVLRGNQLVGAQRAVLSRAGESQTIYTLVVPGAPREDEKPDLWVLTAGIADYPGKDHDLIWCAKDAHRLGECFKQQENTLYRKVNVLELLDDKATQASLSGARRTFLASTRPQDVVLIFLSGHGGSGSFLAHDGPVSWQKVRSEIMHGLAARKVILMLDACHAGAVGTLPGAPVPSFAPGELIKVSSLKTMHQELANAAGCYLFMSSEADQSSEEFFPENPMRPQDKGDRGLLRKLACFSIGDRDDLYDVFAFAVIDGLRGGAADPDGTVTVTTLMAHVDRICRLVRQETATRWYRPIEQRPCFVVPTNSRDFPLAHHPHLRKAPAAAPTAAQAP